LCRVPTRCSPAASLSLSSHYITSCLPISEPGTPARRRAAAASAEHGSGAPAPASKVAWGFFRRMLEALPRDSSLGLGISGKASCVLVRGGQPPARQPPTRRRPWGSRAPCGPRAVGDPYSIAATSALSPVPQSWTGEGQPGSGGDPARTVRGDTVGYETRTALKSQPGLPGCGAGVADQGR